MTPRFRSKLPDVGESVFTVYTRLALEREAINLSQGFPEFNVPEALIDLQRKHQLAGRNQYAPTEGVPALRAAIAENHRRLLGVEVDPDAEITVTAGATQALSTIFTTFVREGDEVIVLEPAYDSYVPGARMNGGVTVGVPLREDFSLDWNALDDTLSERTRILVLNFPHNPGGSLLTDEDLDRLEALAERGDFLIVSDEVYEHITFDGERSRSPIERESLRERTLRVSSFGKTYHATGWKVGYVVAPTALAAEYRKIHQFVVFSVNTPAQHAYAEFAENFDYYDELRAFYQAKRDRLRDALARSGFETLPTKGTYFQLIDYGGISDEADEAFAKRVIREAGVASIPLSPFYADARRAGTRLRLCFAKRDETLDRAAERLATFARTVG
ncbi:MAG: aminotransferase class I/II-fold pyridoxal phosphate-dependent enzyme [Ignavibacteriales bacterium]|nr:aminotransferase class I/II-fold pyridoxal phosphate-dependent enzyme [Ignavibacteriales bacterium]